MKLLVGLGNPGKEYENTRHNAGFLAAEALAKHFDFPPFKMSDKHQAELSEGQIAEEKVILAKPQTYMNLSGQAVQSLAGFYKVQSNDVIVIYDDADLPYGTFRIRLMGSSGGHKGAQSIIDHLGLNFVRLKLGIQPAASFRGELEDYVLGRLTDEESKALTITIQKVPSVLESIIKEGAAETTLQLIDWPIKFE